MQCAWKSWEAYVTELPKFPWTSVYLTSLELEGFSEIVQLTETATRSHSVCHLLWPQWSDVERFQWYGN